MNVIKVPGIIQLERGAPAPPGYEEPKDPSFRQRALSENYFWCLHYACSKKFYLTDCDGVGYSFVSNRARLHYLLEATGRGGLMEKREKGFPQAKVLEKLASPYREEVPVWGLEVDPGRGEFMFVPLSAASTGVVSSAPQKDVVGQWLPDYLFEGWIGWLRGLDWCVRPEYEDSLLLNILRFPDVFAAYKKD